MAKIHNYIFTKLTKLLLEVPTSCGKFRNAFSRMSPKFVKISFNEKAGIYGKRKLCINMTAYFFAFSCHLLGGVQFLYE